MNKMEKTKYEQVIEVLREKGYEPSESIDRGRSVVEWSSRKSEHKIIFDSEGLVSRAEVDGYRMVQMAPFYDQGSERRRWFAQGGFGAGMRFLTLEKHLGIDLFT
jgi:hypothetical protein